jgi:hypothetical protein
MSYSVGTKIECRILPSTCCDKWPLPVVSSTRITSPTPITRLSPSLAVIFTPASRLMMYCRRGAGCQSISCSAWVSNPGGRQALGQLAASPLLDPLYFDVAEMRLAARIGIEIVYAH